MARDRHDHADIHSRFSHVGDGRMPEVMETETLNSSTLAGSLKPPSKVSQEISFFGCE